MKELSREYIKRLGRGSTVISSGGNGGGGGDGVSRSEMMRELAKKVDIEWFDQIFQVYNNTTKLDVNGELPVDQSQLNIKAMFGFWTDFYISALGNGGQASGAIYLSGLADVAISGTPTSGQALVWNGSEWTNGDAGLQSVPWNIITNRPTTISGYGITDAKIQSGTITLGGNTITPLTSSSYLNASNINSGTIGFSYLPTMYWADVQITSSSSTSKVPTLGGAIIGKVCINCSSSGTASGYNNEINDFDSDLALQYTSTNNVTIGYSSRGTNHLTVYGNILASGEVTSLSDYRKKTITEYFELQVERIAEAPMIKYYWNDREDNEKKAGSIAQYWQQMVPELTPTSKDGLLSMDYGKLALLSAISIARKVVNHEERIRRIEHIINNQ